MFFSSADDVHSIVSGKIALRYSGPNVDAMKQIAQASQKRSLADFQKVSLYSEKQAWATKSLLQPQSLAKRNQKEGCHLHFRMYNVLPKISLVQLSRCSDLESCANGVWKEKCVLLHHIINI